MFWYCLSLGCHNRAPYAGWFKKWKFISHGSRSGESVIKVLISLVSGEGCHFGLQMPTLSLSVHMAFPW